MRIAKLITFLIATTILSVPAIQVKTIVSVANAANRESTATTQSLSKNKGRLVELPSEEQIKQTDSKPITEPKKEDSVEYTIPAAEPPPAPPTDSVVASPNVDCELARKIISRYDWNVTVAYQVMVAESSCDAHTQNYNDYHRFANCYGSFGLFQINCARGKVFNAEENVAIAYSMWKASGWKPWSATTCKYKVKCY